MSSDSQSRFGVRKYDVVGDRIAARTAHQTLEEEIASLVTMLHAVEQRLEILTGGEVDAVADSEGHPYLLRRPQELMRYSEAVKQTAIIDSLPAHMALIDEQGVVVSVNRAWRKFGEDNQLRSADGGLGMNYLQVCDSATGEYGAESHRIAEGLRAVIGGRLTALSIEYPCHSEHEKRWFLLMAAPLAATSPCGAVVLHVDISERREAEQSIRSLNATLEQRVAQRTTQLELLNSELEAFSYTVSHDLRAPLRHVLAYSQILEEELVGSLSPENSRRLKLIGHSANHMSKLIADLLEFARIGSASLQVAPTDLQELVGDVLGDFVQDTAARQVVFNVHVLPVVSGDRALLRMVLVNLISNALKFTAQRLIATIEIGTLGIVDGEIVVYVKDNGAGFDECHAAKLFGVFERLHSQADFAGTGIGLANVKRIIGRHGGRVWATGIVDEGAVFYFSIPNTISDTRIGF